MKRGSLLIYDNNGVVWFNSGDSEGDVPEHIKPVGLPCIVTNFGELNNVKKFHVDVNKKEIVIEEYFNIKPSYEELENQLLKAEGVL